MVLEVDKGKIGKLLAYYKEGTDRFWVLEPDMVELDMVELDLVLNNGNVEGKLFGEGEKEAGRNMNKEPLDKGKDIQ